MEVLTSYLKNIAFNPLKARAFQAAPALLRNEAGLSPRHVQMLLSGDAHAIHSAIAHETGDRHGRQDVAASTTVVVLVLATTGIEQVH